MLVDGVKGSDGTVVWVPAIIVERKATCSGTALLFKLLRASIAGGQEPALPTITHQAQCKDSSESPHISTILHINGVIGHSPVTFLLDSGAAMSIV